MEVMFDRVAGSGCRQGVGDGVLRTPGPKGRRHAETRTFRTTTVVHLMREWLVKAGVSIAAMESTSVYWKAPFYCLEEVMEVWLLNAARASKAVPGRKVSVGTRNGSRSYWSTACWRRRLPPPEIRRLRMLTRYRVQLMGDRRRDIVRLELMLEDASIKLSSVASSLKTVCRPGRC